MPECPCCGTVHYDILCRWCEERREELLERLQLDKKAASIEVVSGWALHGMTETPERCWEVG